MIKTFVIKKKGRKYFDTEMGGHNAKLVINDVSKPLENEQLVKIHVKDISERSRYGTSLKFEPLAILDDQDAEAIIEADKARKEAGKWLTYAEYDANKGLIRSNAIKKAMSLCPSHEEFRERLSSLKSRVNVGRLLLRAFDEPSIGEIFHCAGKMVVAESINEPSPLTPDYPYFFEAEVILDCLEGDYVLEVNYREATDGEVSELVCGDYRWVEGVKLPRPRHI